MSTQVRVVGNECSLGSDLVAENYRIDGELARWTRTSGSTAGQRSSRRRSFFLIHEATYEGKVCA